jgi:hypothetical protein
VSPRPTLKDFVLAVVLSIATIVSFTCAALLMEAMR